MTESDGGFTPRPTGRRSLGADLDALAARAVLWADLAEREEPPRWSNVLRCIGISAAMAYVLVATAPARWALRRLVP